MSLALPLALYLELGWACTPLNDERTPCWSSFGDRPLKSVDELPPDAAGLGILPSLSGLVDIDCDTDEMVAAAALLMPPTACFGHSGQVRHYLYAYVGDDPPFLNYHEGEFRAGKTSKGGHDRYTAIPPTPSKRGEPTTWTRPPEDLASLPTGELVYLYARASLIAKLARAARPHQRHTLHLEIAGSLLKRGWPEDEVRLLVSQVCTVSKDPDYDDRQAAVTSTLVKHAAGEKLRTLSEAKGEAGFGLGKIFDRISELRGWAPAAATNGSILLTGIAAEDAEKLAEALSKDPTLYTRGGALVRVRDVDGLPCVEAHDRWSIMGPLAQYAPTHMITKFGAKRCDPPETTVTTMLRMPAWPGSRVLTDVLTSPTLRIDGSPIAAPGYDEEARALLWELPGRSLAGFEVGRTRADGRRALRSLLEVIENFPLDDQGRCVWLALLLTLASRPLVKGPVPMFIADAPLGGSGKSLLITLASIITNGAECPTMAAPYSEEATKVYYAVGASGRPLLFLDNCDRKSPESDALEQAVTQGQISTRLMRTNREASTPFRCVVAISGNNVSFSDTFERRALRIRLGAVADGPREFAQPRVREWCQKFSTGLLGHVLTALRAFLEARARQDPSTLAAPPTRTLVSFEEWSALVPQCLAWYGLPDVVAGAVEERMRATSSDDWRESAVEHVAAWAAKLPEAAGGEFRAKTLWARVSEGSFGGSSRELRESLEAAIGRPLKTAVDVGRALSRLRDVPTGPTGFERTLRARLDDDGVSWWRVEGAAVLRAARAG